MLCFFGYADEGLDSFYFLLGFDVLVAASLELFFLFEEQMPPVFVLSFEKLIILLQSLVAVLNERDIGLSGHEG